MLDRCAPELRGHIYTQACLLYIYLFFLKITFCLDLKTPVFAFCPDALSSGSQGKVSSVCVCVCARARARAERLLSCTAVISQDEVECSS